MIIKLGFTWVMGHRIPSEHSEEYNLHGHTYNADVAIEIENNDIHDEVLWRELWTNVFKGLNYSFMWHDTDPLLQFADKMDKWTSNNDQKRLLKFNIMNFEPTTENIRKYIFDEIVRLGYEVVSVSIDEGVKK